MEITQLLEVSLTKKASDLHITTGMPPILRVDGELRPFSNLEPLDAETTKKLIYSVLNKEQQQTLETRKQLDFLVNIPDFANFRVNAFYQLHGLAAVFRIIPQKIPTLDELIAPPIFKKLLSLRRGLILLTGPTGSGKSTSLAAMVDHINMNEARHIITIEDPIEFVHTFKKSVINQRQIHRDTNDTSEALRAALREDPDVILIGEMRDLETIRLALTAAETGHLVMATLHTSSAPRAVSRIIDVFPGGEKNIIRNLISESLQAVICQTLVKKIGGGRTAAFEVMIANPAIRNLIREDKTAQMYSVIQTSAKLGMQLMSQSLQVLIDQQVVRPEDAHVFGFERELFEDLTAL